MNDYRGLLVCYGLAHTKHPGEQDDLADASCEFCDVFMHDASCV
jgi:hypothetical protein